MKKIRIGNDIPIKWVIKRDGHPEDFTGKQLKILMRSSIGEETEITDYTLNGNVLSWMFYGKDQSQLVTYSFTLIENDGQEGMYTVDACNALQLVKCSNEADTIVENELTSEIQIPAIVESAEIDLAQYAKKADVDLKQNITDDSLQTTDKTIVGAINELLTKINEIINNNNVQS